MSGRQTEARPIPAKAVEIGFAGDIVGAGRNGFAVGAMVRVRLEGVDSRVTSRSLYRRIRRVLEEHVGEITEVES